VFSRRSAAPARDAMAVLDLLALEQDLRPVDDLESIAIR
jgi:hypothetical protein